MPLRVEADTRILLRSLIRGSMGTGGIVLLNRFLVLAMAIVLARILGPEAYGHYAFALSCVALLSIPIQAGLPALVTREVARAELAQNWPRMRGLLQFANRFVAVLSSLAVCVAAAVVWWFLTGDGDGGVAALLWALLLAPLFGFVAVRAATLRGLRHAVVAQVPPSVVPPSLMLLMLGVAGLAGLQLSAVAAVQLQILAWVGALGMAALLLRWALPAGWSSQPSERQTRAWLTGLMPLSALAAMRMADAEIAIVLLGLLGTGTDVGLYRVATQGALVMLMGSMAVGMVMLPHLARLFEQGDVARLQELMRYSSLAAFLFALPVFLLFALWGEALIRLVFGAEYAGAHRALMILAAANLVSVAAGFPGLLLNMTGLSRKALPASVIVLIGNAVLCYLLIPLLGLDGAALAAGVLLIVWKATLAGVARRETGIDTALLPWKLPGRHAS